MSYATLILIVIKIILTGIDASSAVSRVAGDYGVDSEKLWDLLPDVYK